MNNRPSKAPVTRFSEGTNCIIQNYQINLTDHFTVNSEKNPFLKEFLYLFITVKLTEKQTIPSHNEAYEND